MVYVRRVFVMMVKMDHSDVWLKSDNVMIVKNTIVISAVNFGMVVQSRTFGHVNVVNQRKKILDSDSPGKTICFHASNPISHCQNTHRPSCSNHESGSVVDKRLGDSTDLNSQRHNETHV